MHAYQETIHTAAERAPWYAVPADNKWFTRMVVASVIETLDSLDLHYSKLGKDEETQLAAAKQELIRNN
jgi:polyphosphate kinase 2 (PPK2 family)